jgi:hypothetical protein
VQVRRALVLLVVLAACTATSDPTTTTEPVSWDTTAPFVGFSLSPLSYDQAGFDEFFARSDDAADLVAWVGAWGNLEQGGTLVYDMSFDYGFVPIVVTGLPTDAGGLRVIPEDSDEMIDTIRGWVADHPVPFLGFGVETNSFLSEKAPEDFEWFVGAFPQLARAVHDVSPETVVFPGFQLERLRGMKDGLFGGERTEPNWELIDRFPDADVIGFTTYPGLIFSTPASMPDDYYEEIHQHTEKPIVFTEVGWQAGGELGEWTGTPRTQADFVTDRLPELAGMSQMVVWSFLYDQEAGGPPFQTMGLIDSNGSERTGWGRWLEIFG